MTPSGHLLYVNQGTVHQACDIGELKAVAEFLELHCEDVQVLVTVLQSLPPQFIQGLGGKLKKGKYFNES